MTQKIEPGPFWERTQPEPNSGCLLWTAGAIRAGYGVARHGGLSARAHRLAWEITNGPIPPGTLVCHKCDVRLCVNPAHLFLGSHAANNADMIAKGRNVVLKGARHGMAKLTPDMAQAIRADQRTQREIAADYGIRHAQVGRIKRGEHWASAS